MLKHARSFEKSTLSLVILTAALIMGFPFSSGAANSSEGVIQVNVNGSVTDAVGRLKKLVADNDMMIMGELHQGKVLSMTGISLQSESVFVGSPTVGKKLFSAEPGAGVVVPVRINLYADKQGKTVVIYTKPSTILHTFGNADVDKVADMLDTKLHNMVQMLAQ